MTVTTNENVVFTSEWDWMDQYEEEDPDDPDTWKWSAWAAVTVGDQSLDALTTIVAGDNTYEDDLSPTDVLPCPDTYDNWTEVPGYEECLSEAVDSARQAIHDRYDDLHDSWLQRHTEGAIYCGSIWATGPRGQALSQGDYHYCERSLYYRPAQQDYFCTVESYNGTDGDGSSTCMGTLVYKIDMDTAADIADEAGWTADQCARYHLPYQEEEGDHVHWSNWPGPCLRVPLGWEPTDCA